MTDTKSLALMVGMFALAAAIVFHAWWPGYEVEQYVTDCMAPTIEKVNRETQYVVGELTIEYLERIESELFETEGRCIKEANLLFR